jgi:hypothetical protein
VTFPDEAGWRVRSGAGLLIHTPMSDARREQLAKEDERERRQVELEATNREVADEERRFALQLQGHEPRSVAEFLAQIAADDARRERARERREEMGLPVADDDVFGVVQPQREEREWRPTPWELRESQAARKEAAETTSASQADVAAVESKLSSQLVKVKAALYKATGHKAI